MGRFLSVLIAALVALGGCTVMPDDPPQDKRPGPAEQDMHTCVGACDHFYADGGWKLAGHTHKEGCGHVLVNGRWVKAPPPPPPDDPDKKRDPN